MDKLLLLVLGIVPIPAKTLQRPGWKIRTALVQAANHYALTHLKSRKFLRQVLS